MTIRFVRPGDSGALLAIYEQYIDTPITFEYTLPAEGEFAERIAAISREYPYLVYEEGGRALGYAYAHRYKEREAYQWSAELSVYLDRSAVSRGAGRRLYSALMELLSLQGIKTVYGVITVPNEKSEELHRALGFQEVGVYRAAGYKSGGWRDVLCCEKRLAPFGTDIPQPILPVGEVPQEDAVRILERWG